MEGFIKKETMLVLSAGKYSDYMVIAIGKAIQDIDVEQLRSEYFKLYPEQKKSYGLKPSQFLSWLITDKKVIEEMNYEEWWFSDYHEPTISYLKR